MDRIPDQMDIDIDVDHTVDACHLAHHAYLDLRLHFKAHNEGANKVKLLDWVENVTP